MYSEDLIKEAVQKEMVNYTNNNNNQYATVNKDGKKLAIIDADKFEDGLIIVPGKITAKLKWKICRSITSKFIELSSVCLYFLSPLGFPSLLSTEQKRLTWNSTGKNKNFTVLEEVNANDLNTKYMDGKHHQVYPYDKKYSRGDQTDDQYSLNVLNLEGKDNTI